MKSTSWESVGKWYHEAVGEEGLYYHRNLILPGVLRLLSLEAVPSPSILDLGCGQGILARSIPPQVPYLGLDLSSSLIKAAQKLDSNPVHHYQVADVTKPFPIKERKFTDAVAILSVQNLEQPASLFRHLSKVLVPRGRCVLVLNHPCFRIPRQSSWQVDASKKVQYRRLDQYMSPLKIPIQAHPGRGRASENTWSFHHPISAYSKWLYDAGFATELLEEWCSNKTSTGGAAKMENRSRAEFPLFLAIVARLR